MPDGRVLIAFDDGPLVASPTWTRIDDPTGSNFPQNFVAGYDTRSGRQTLLSQTDTGTATVYFNDNKYGLFDPTNSSSPYYGKLDGGQIMLQLYDPVRAVWEPQWRGTIDDILYNVDGSGVDQNGDPINVAVQFDCVDIFDYLSNYGLTPGLDGVKPPVGSEDGVWYAETVGTVQDRFLAILNDVGIDPTMSIIAAGNVHVQAVKYDPDEAAIVGCRDAADAELPFIANIYVNRSGQFVFRGRYSRFDPDGVAAEPGSTWDFTRWPVGDQKAINADGTRAQMRVLSYTRNRSDIVNVAVCYPANMKPEHMPQQVFADTASITAYGKHSAPPMSDLLTKSRVDAEGGQNANDECYAFAELLVKNQKDPRVGVGSIQLKSVHPSDPRAANVWATMTQADVSHIVNMRVGYPGGTGFTGASPDDDHYIEGRELQVRPTGDSSFDAVTMTLSTTPFEWSADTHGVFPAFGSF